MHIIQEAFGETRCDLYAHVLQCPRDADKAALRKAYYRQALKYHPDKNPNDNQANLRFQAITTAYQILQDPDLRAAYDESGELPDLCEEQDSVDGGTDQWKSYFAHIFGKVTTGGIEAFSAKYKCSDEERRDVLKEFKARKGNLEKMLDYVMLSEPRDAERWVEDYLRPAMESSGEADPSFAATMEKSLKKLQKKVEQEDAAEEPEEEMEDDDDDDNDDTNIDGNNQNNKNDQGEETESEEDEPSLAARRKRRLEEAAAGKKKTTARKKAPPPAKYSSKPATKKAKGGAADSMTDLMARIQNNKNGRGGGQAGAMMARLGARYGVSMDDDDNDKDDDPLSDEAFAAIQSKLLQNRQQKKK